MASNNSNFRSATKAPVLSQLGTSVAWHSADNQGSTQSATRVEPGFQGRSDGRMPSHIRIQLRQHWSQGGSLRVDRKIRVIARHYR